MNFEGWLSADEAAEMLGITRKSVYDYALRLDGFPQPKRVGRTLLFEEKALRLWREEHPARRRS